jgi:hypothetical protein
MGLLEKGPRLKCMMVGLYDLVIKQQQQKQMELPDAAGQCLPGQAVRSVKARAVTHSTYQTCRATLLYIN